MRKVLTVELYGETVNNNNNNNSNNNNSNADTKVIFHKPVRVSCLGCAS